MSLEHLEQQLRDRIGLDTDTIGRHVLEHAVDLRRLKLSIPTREAYVQAVSNDLIEWDELVELLIVPETWFFRGEMTYDYLRQFVRTDPQLSQANSVLRILSAPCSTGEEPYSIVMALFHDGWPADRLMVDGIDLSQRSLTFAAKAEYGARSFREKTPLANACMARYFTDHDGMRQLSPEISTAVRFRHVNVANPSFTAATLTAVHGRYDIIFCRNLMIYLHEAERRRLCDSLLKMLRPGGIVFAGHADPLSRIDTRFEIVPPIGAFMYRCESDAENASNTFDRSAASVRPGSARASRNPGSTRPFPAKKRKSPLDSTGAASGSEAPTVRAEKPGRKTTGRAPLAAGTGKESPKATSVEPASFDFGPPTTKNPETPDEPTADTAAAGSTDLLAVAMQAANQGDFGKATELCRQYLQSTPQNAAAYCLLGLILQSQQQFDEARRYYERALYLDPEHAESLTHLMLDAQRQGDRQTAQNYARRLHRLQQKLLANEAWSGESH